uniref:Tectonic-1-3 domain-containing protein n=1 Tax=Oncorhynchus mykiss TaxID=8022 RepID=A0A8K9Y6W7_ONCMY
MCYAFFYMCSSTPKPRPSFQKPVLSAPLPTHIYQQGDPIFTISDQYFTIPQNSLVGQCVDNAPVAFLKNFQAQCVTRLLSCPTGPPLQTTPTELRVQVRDGQGGVVTVDVTDKMAVDLRPFVASPVAEDGRLLCENVTLALNYKFFWKGNGLTNITLTRILGNVLSASVGLTASYSVVFLNGDALAQPNSGNPGYQVGRPVIGGIVDTLGNGTVIQRTPVNLWKPVSSGLCASEGRIVLFGENSTAGCLLPVSLQNLTQCSLLSQNVASLQRALSTATHIARNGDPDVLNLTDWLNISFVELNSNQPVGGGIGICSGIPSHRHIHVRSIVTEVVGGLPQREIQAVEVSDHVSTWKFECGGGDPCLEPTGIQTFPVTSSITFTDISINTGPPKTRFQINFTEYDCDRNDVCWPQLAFPLTRYYTGESYSLSLAKGLILVFFFITASILGTPWKQIRQAWRSASL